MTLIDIDVPKDWRRIALFLDACDLTNSEGIWIALQLITKTLESSQSPAREVIVAGVIRFLTQEYPDARQVESAASLNLSNGVSQNASRIGHEANDDN